MQLPLDGQELKLYPEQVFATHCLHVLAPLCPFVAVPKVQPPDVPHPDTAVAYPLAHGLTSQPVPALFF